MKFVPLIIQELREETDEYRSIIFTKPKDFTFILGECFSFRFPGEDNAKVFSFASSPSEDSIIISYKKGMSPFKKKLESLQVGDVMEVSLYGSQFRFNETKSSVFIAGGIGITAFRSIIVYCRDKNVSSPIHLLFLNKTEHFPFRQELDSLIKQLPQLSVSYHATSTSGRLTKETLAKLIGSKSNEMYIAGPPLMIDHTVELLKKNGIHESHIHTESFDGYGEES